MFRDLPCNYRNTLACLNLNKVLEEAVVYAFVSSLCGIIMMVLSLFKSEFTVASMLGFFTYLWVILLALTLNTGEIMHNAILYNQKRVS
ncbi:hypothetical protein L3V83_12740 [Thiotrichales bacterium 19X7-9]|nr:hypothetical protein [Thiotrichales bacterium 19X7-9]